MFIIQVHGQPEKFIRSPRGSVKRRLRTAVIIFICWW